jgi:hypothetical protein
MRAAATALAVLALTPHPTHPPLAIVTAQSGGSSVLARLDPLTLRPRDPTLRLGEYHGSWSFSPNGKRLVVGTSAGGPAEGRGIHIVDVASVRELGTIQVPIAVEALAWLSRRRIAGALQGDVFVADPVLGRVVMHRDAPSLCSVTPRTGVVRDKLVLLFDHAVLTVGTGKRVRQARLRGAPDNCSGGDLVVDRRRGRAFTIGAGSSVGEVRLRTMRARSHRVAGAAARGRYTDALWLGHRGLVAAATCGRSSARSSGVELIDTRAWRRRVLEPRACGVARAGHTLFAFDANFTDARGIGLRAFGLSGRPRWRLFRGRSVWNVQVAGRFAYVIGARGLSVVDLRSHKVVHRSRSAPDEVEFLRPR